MKKNNKISSAYKPEYWPIQADDDISEAIKRILRDMDEMSNNLKNVKSAFEKGEYKPTVEVWKKEFYDKK